MDNKVVICMLCFGMFAISAIVVFAIAIHLIYSLLLLGKCYGIMLFICGLLLVSFVEREYKNYLLFKLWYWIMSLGDVMDILQTFQVIAIISLSYSACGIVGGFVVHRFIYGYWYWNKVYWVRASWCFYDEMKVCLGW